MPRPPAGGIAVAFGRVYVNTFEHKVYALDQETGAVVWSSPTSTGTTTQESGASVGFGTVYVGSDDGLYTFNAATGKAGWVFPLPSPALESSAVIHYDVGVGNPGLVMIGTNDKTLYAINANNGSRVWSYTANTPQGFRNVVVAEKRAFINDFTAITALDGNTGTLIWTQPTVNFSTNSPAVSNGILYYMEAATVRGIRTSNGQMVWDAPIPGNGNAVANGNSMAIDRGLLIVPNSGHVYAFGQ
jgi:outer membrane protein assembly factor BamB